MPTKNNKTTKTKSDLPIVLETIRDNKGIPALASAMQRDGNVIELASTGVRKLGKDVLVTNDDLWHTGSCTKAMTATLAGILIDGGNINWTTTIGEVFPDWKGKINDKWKAATLEQLLCHHAGAPHQVLTWIWEKAQKDHQKDAQKQRQSFVHNVLQNPTAHSAGTAFCYSNAGYSIAGHMLETVMKCDWETLISENVFQPLGMDSAGFGAPGKAGKIMQPYGHELKKGVFKPIMPGPKADNPSLLAPGATVHCSLGDLLKFAASHAGTNALVSEEVLHRLHRRYAASEYGAGWYVVERYWGRGYVLSHTGSNSYWFASMWVAPYRKTAFVAVANAGGESASSACNQAIDHLIVRHFGQR